MENIVGVIAEGVGLNTNYFLWETHAAVLGLEPALKGRSSASSPLRQPSNLRGPVKID